MRTSSSGLPPPCHSGCDKTHHAETSLIVPLINEISLRGTSHDETPNEETSHDETFLGETCDSMIPPGETCRGALHYGSSGGFLGLCFCYPVD
jgi:hypothetical protein